MEASDAIFSKLKKKDGGKLVPKHQTGKKIESISEAAFKALHKDL